MQLLEHAWPWKPILWSSQCTVFELIWRSHEVSRCIMIDYAGSCWPPCTVHFYQLAYCSVAELLFSQNTSIFFGKFNIRPANGPLNHLPTLWLHRFYVVKYPAPGMHSFCHCPSMTLVQLLSHESSCWSKSVGTQKTCYLLILPLVITSCSVKRLFLHNNAHLYAASFGHMQCSWFSGFIWTAADRDWHW